MKKEDLTAIGLSDEQITKIFEFNGKDIAAEQNKFKDYEELKTKLSTAETSLKEANAKTEEFKGMDIEGVKKAADEWKTKYETEKADNEVKLAKLSYDNAASEFIKSLNPKDDLSATALLTEFAKKEFQLKDKVFQGANEWAEELKTKYPDHFKSDKPIPTITTGGTPPAAGADDAALRSMFGLNTEKK